MAAKPGEEKKGRTEPRRGPQERSSATDLMPPQLAVEVVRELPGLVLLLDRRWAIRGLNRDAETLIGLSADLARGKNWFSAFVPKHNRDQALRGFEQSLRAGAAAETMSLVKASDGTDHSVCWRLRTLQRGGDGEELRLVLGTDITERKWKEEHRKLLSSMVEQSTEGMAVIDPQGSIIFINRACAQMHGYEALELIGEDISTLWGGAGRLALEQVSEEIEKRGVFTGEVRFRRRGGALFPILLQVSTLEDDTGGAVGFVCTMRDLTERKGVEAALRQSRERLRSVVQSAPVVLWAVDREGKFTLSEGKGLSALGLKPGEVLGQSVFELYANIPEIRDAVRRALGGESLSASVAVGQLVYDSRYAPLRNEQGEVIGVTGVATDVTERVQAEEALRQRARQQTAVAQFGQKGLAGLALQELFDEASSLVAGTLDVEFAKILELAPDGGSLLLKAGVGWKAGYVGKASVSAQRESQAGYTLLNQEPVIVEDLREEPRFSGPPLLYEHGVVSGMSVIIHGRRRAFGVLGAHTSKRRRFSSDDIHFLQAVANVLAVAIDRKKSEEEHARLAKAIEQTPESIIITDAEARIQYVNPAFERITGYGSEEALGENPRILKSGEHDGSFYRQMWKTLTAGKTWAGFLINRHKDGSLYREQATISPVVDDSGRIINYVGVKRDLTAPVGG